jgi:hypothetical protein
MEPVAPVEALEVGAHRPSRQSERAGDLLVRETLRNQIDDLTVPGRQSRIVRSVDPFRLVFDKHLTDPVRKLRPIAIRRIGCNTDSTT